MRKFLIFDTEGSGLFDYAAPADAEGQPRLAEFAGMTAEERDDDGALELGLGYHYLVRPDGWTMTPEATAVNGLTTEFLLEHGNPIAGLLDWYVARVREGYIMATFNARHDLKQMRAELRRAGREDDFESTLNTCLMRACHKKEVAVPHADGSRRGFPKLSDACRHFGIPLNDDHRALTGAAAAMEVFRRLWEMGRLLDPDVHYAKDRPMPPAQGTLDGANDDANF